MNEKDTCSIVMLSLCSMLGKELTASRFTDFGQTNSVETKDHPISQTIFLFHPSKAITSWYTDDASSFSG